MNQKHKPVRYKDLFAPGVRPELLNLNTGSNKKITIFSDCHLTKRFDYKRFAQFKKVILDSDVVIINGDFWDDAHISFTDFLSSPWSQLFALLKAKQTYYLYGNHDMPILSNKDLFRFCNEAGFRMKVTAGSVKLHVEHGHLLSGWVVRTVLHLFETRPRLLHIVTLPLGIGEKLMRNVVLKGNSAALQKINTGFKQKRFAVSDPEEYFVMGHTHTPEYDKKLRYVNSGFTHDGHFSYVRVYKNTVKLVIL